MHPLQQSAGLLYKDVVPNEFALRRCLGMKMFQAKNVEHRNSPLWDLKPWTLSIWDHRFSGPSLYLAARGRMHKVVS